MNQEANRNKLRMQINQEELVERMLKLLPEDGVLEAMPGFFLARSSKPIETRVILQPAFCFVVQGGKRVMLGEEIFWYDSGRYLIFTVDLPLVFKVEEASTEKPYLGFRLDLDPKMVAEIMMEAEFEIPKNNSNIKAIDVNLIDVDLIDVVVRLVRLLDAPNENKSLFQLTFKEIILRLLKSGQGLRLSHLLTSEGDTKRISKAIGHLRQNFDKPLKIENIARQFGMSVSGFHQHFKNVTAMSPLQFQKQLRLQEARRLMLGEDLDAANAGFRVGYEDPAYFSRDYKKLFGEPPLRDIVKLRSTL
jgi:AraC-like DNA-binding protein